MKTWISVQALRWKAPEWCVFHRHDRTRRCGRWKSEQTEEQIVGEGTNAKEMPWDPPHPAFQSSLTPWALYSRLCDRTHWLDYKGPPVFLGEGGKSLSHSCVAQQDPTLATQGVDWLWVCSTAGRIFLHSKLAALQFQQQERCVQSLGFHIPFSKPSHLKCLDGTSMLKEIERLVRWLRQVNAATQPWGPEFILQKPCKMSGMVLRACNLRVW